MRKSFRTWNEMKFRCTKKDFLIGNKKESKFCLKNYKMRINDIENNAFRKYSKMIPKGYYIKIFDN